MGNIPFQGSEIQLEIGKQLGSGSFSIVYEAILNNKPIALKKINKKSQCYSEALLFRELDLSMPLNHLNIVKTERVFSRVKKPDFVYIVMELCDENLSSKIQAPNKLHYLQILGILKQISEGLNYLYREDKMKKKIIHRDIKPDNILIKGNLIKIADFSLCRKIDKKIDPQQTYSQVGTPFYRAPEVWQARNYTEKADI